jgi:hypothetical protein
MTKSVWFFLAILAASAIQLPIPMAAAVTNFTEDFATTSANWISPDAPATFVPGGGPDGSSYVTAQRNPSQISFMNSVTVLTGMDSLNASSDQFVGDWLGAGITHFSTYVRHNAPVALPFSTRFATSANFPGTTSIDTVIQPNTWTQLNYDILPSSINTSLFPEGPPSVFNQTFSAVGNIQFFFTVPAALAGITTNYTFGFDKIATTPEPSAGLLMLTAMLGGLGIRRREVA